jgi:hypothetical protein
MNESRNLKPPFCGIDVRLRPLVYDEEVRYRGDLLLWHLCLTYASTEYEKKRE